MKAKAPSSQKGPSSEGPRLASPAPPRSKPRQGGETPPLTSLLPTQWAQNTHPDHLPSSEQEEASASSYGDSETGSSHAPKWKEVPSGLSATLTLPPTLRARGRAPRQGSLCLLVHLSTACPLTPSQVLETPQGPPRSAALSSLSLVNAPRAATS